MSYYKERNDIQIDFFTENFERKIRTYDRIYGWPVVLNNGERAGTDDRHGYYLGLQVRGKNGTTREVAIVLTKSALEDMLELVNDRYPDPYEQFTPPFDYYHYDDMDF